VKKARDNALIQEGLPGVKDTMVLSDDRQILSLRPGLKEDIRQGYKRVKFNYNQICLYEDSCGLTRLDGLRLHENNASTYWYFGVDNSERRSVFYVACISLATSIKCRSTDL